MKGRPEPDAHALLGVTDWVTPSTSPMITAIVLAGFSLRRSLGASENPPLNGLRIKPQGQLLRDRRSPQERCCRFLMHRSFKRPTMRPLRADSGRTVMSIPFAPKKTCPRRCLKPRGAGMRVTLARRMSGLSARFFDILSLKDVLIPERPFAQVTRAVKRGVGAMAAGSAHRWGDGPMSRHRARLG